MKRLEFRDVGGFRVALNFYPDHTSGNGHFPDQWTVMTARIPFTGRGTTTRTFKTFVSAKKFFNARVAQLEAGK